VTDQARGHRGISCFAVPAQTQGLRFVRALELSAPHPLGEIAFEDCRVPADAIVGAEGEGFKLGLATLDRLRPTVAAAACGMATRALAGAGLRASAPAVRPPRRISAGSELSPATELTAARLLVYRAAGKRQAATGSRLRPRWQGLRHRPPACGRCGRSVTGRAAGCSPTIRSTGCTVR
jgi:acyl-CoA dehydrogenase